MIYDKEDVDVMLEEIQRLIIAANIDHLIFPAPSYIHGPNWTDELREKNGFEQVEGVWCRKVDINDYWLTQMNGVRKLVEDIKRLSAELSFARRKIYEMEYGLRVAQKSLNNALTMEKEDV
jgi:hypothetical protein